MRVRIEPFTRERVAAVRAFNRRLAAGGAGWRFPEDPVPDWLPPAPESRVCQQYFLLLEDEDVRGAYILKHREVSFRGELRRVAAIELPLSEGTINGAYARVAYQLVRDALRRQPLLFGVGFGGEDVPIARLTRALGWRMQTVPFYFKVIHGTRFLRQLRYLRTTRLRSFLMDAAALSGLGWVGAKAAGAVLSRSPRATYSAIVADVVDRFGDWADDLWELCRERYSFIGLRDADALNRIYTAGRPHLLRLKVLDSRRVLGYAVIESQQTAASEYFGDIRVGTLMDGLALPEHAETVVWHATRMLEQLGVDLLVSNQHHRTWGTALRRAGFLPGPSNFLFGTAQELTRLLDTVDPDARELHLNRGDGQWPWNPGFRIQR